jgi:endoglucanase
MGDLVPFLKELLSLPGLSGNETPVLEVIQRTWGPLSDSLRVSRMGSLEALKSGQGDSPRPSILLAAHMDAIGMMVTGVVDGFLSFTRIGGVDPRVLPGQPVMVHGREKLPGIVVQPPDHLSPPEIGARPLPLDRLWVDVGRTAEETARLVRPGDLISYNTAPVELSGELIAGHTLDNRASVAAVTHCLEILSRRIHSADVYAVATVEEEVTFGGGYTSAFHIQPDLAIAIDVCQAQGPGTAEAHIPLLGNGAVVGKGPNIHPYIQRALSKTAEEMEIPFIKRGMAAHSGTDAYPMQITAGGIPTGVISIPLRYMHTPVEVVSLKDIRRVGRLLAEFITTLDRAFVDHITWDE